MKYSSHFQTFVSRPSWHCYSLRNETKQRILATLPARLENYLKSRVVGSMGRRCCIMTPSQNFTPCEHGEKVIDKRQQQIDKLSLHTVKSIQLTAAISVVASQAQED